MEKALRRVILILMTLIILFSISFAEEINSQDITKELDRIKTQHDGGFAKEEEIEGDLHAGWGLGVFYIQGYSSMIIDVDGSPVFLLQEGDQIMLGFHLKQDLDALNGNSGYKINSDSNGFDTVFGVQQMYFGKGCLIIQRTNGNNQIEEPQIYTDYLLNVAENSFDSLIGPLGEGYYSAALDYEVQYTGFMGVPGYNDYKIPFSFKIQNIKDYYKTAGVATIETFSQTQKITIVVAIIGIVIFAVVLFIIIRRHKSQSIKKSLDRPRRLKKWALLCVYIILLVVCICVLNPILSNPTTYPETIKYLDEKFGNANLLMAGTASASFIISFLPDDFGTPIASELAKITGYVLVVISAIVLEKYLLTSIGFVASMIIPIVAFVMGVIWLFLQEENKKKIVAEYAIRLVIFGICIALFIPLGCSCGRGIEALNSEPINKSLRDAAEANQIVEQLPDEEEDRSIIEKAISDILKGFKEKIDWATDKFNGFVQSVAVMMVTTIAIPIIIFIAFIWAIRFLTKRDFTNVIFSFSKRISDGTADQIGNASKKIKENLKDHKEMDFDEK